MEDHPVPEGGLDLIVTVTSFDHWSDQRAGLRQCARALAGGGVLVLTDPVLGPVGAHHAGRQAG